MHLAKSQILSEFPVYPYLSSLYLEFGGKSTKLKKLKVPTYPYLSALKNLIRRQDKDTTLLKGGGAAEEDEQTNTANTTASKPEAEASDKSNEVKQISSSFVLNASF